MNEKEKDRMHQEEDIVRVWKGKSCIVWSFLRIVNDASGTLFAFIFKRLVYAPDSCIRHHNIVMLLIILVASFLSSNFSMQSPLMNIFSCIAAAVIRCCCCCIANFSLSFIEMSIKKCELNVYVTLFFTGICMIKCRDTCMLFKSNIRTIICKRIQKGYSLINDTTNVETRIFNLGWQFVE